MKYRAVLLPRDPIKTEQVFSESLDEIKKWARRVLWGKCRKLITDGQIKSQEAVQELWNEAGRPHVVIYRTQEQQFTIVCPWDVTDDDKKPVTGE